MSFNQHGKLLSDWAGTLKFKLDSGEDLLVFCIQIDVRVRSGDRYRSDGPVLALPNGCKIQYLLDMYPASTAKDADEAAARQLAIWVFSDGVDPRTIADTKVRDRVIALVNEAKAKPCLKPRTEAPDLTLAPPIANAAVGQVVAYTVRASPADAGQSVTVSVGGPAVFSDANGTNSGLQQQHIRLDGQSGATFWVLSMGAGETTVKVVLPYRLGAGTVYSQLDDTSPTQRLVLAENLNLVAEASAKALWSAQVPSPSPAQQTTVLAMTPSPPAATSPPATRRPEKDRTPAPTEQLTVTVAAGETEGATPVLTAEDTALPAPTTAPAANEQAGAAAQPRSLPRTGEPTGPAIGLILLAVAALFVGALLRGRRILR